MRTRLLFYKTENTEVNEKIVKNALAKYGLTLSGSVSTYTPVDLMHALSTAVEMSELILIVGGLDLPGRDNIIRVLSQSLGIFAEEAGRSRSKYIVDHVHNMPQPTLTGSSVLYSRLDGADGIAIDSGTQCIICLPMHEAQLSDMLSGSAAEHFTARYGLTEVSFIGTGQIGLQNHDSFEKTLNLSSFGENYNNEAAYEHDQIQIHGKKQKNFWEIALKIMIAVVITAIVCTVTFFGFSVYSEQSSDYIAKNSFSEVKSV